MFRVTNGDGTGKHFVKLHKNIYDVLKNNAQAVVSIESAVDVVRVTDLAYQSARIK